MGDKYLEVGILYFVMFIVLFGFVWGDIWRLNCHVI